MKKFLVSGSVVVETFENFDIEVEAETEEEAVALVEQMDIDDIPLSFELEFNPELKYLGAEEVE